MGILTFLLKTFFNVINSLKLNPENSNKLWFWEIREQYLLIVPFPLPILAFFDFFVNG